MICPSCGLHNPSNAEICIGCKHPLPLSSAEPTPDPNPSADAPTENPTAEDAPVSSPSNIPTAEDSRQPRADQVSVPDLKQQPFETVVKDFLDRDLVRTEAASSGPAEKTPELPEPALTEPSYPEAEPSAGHHPDARMDVQSTQAPAILQSGATMIPKSQGTLFSDKIQRIEIKLNQTPLPFGESNSQDDLLGDSIHQELRSATVWDRFGAGILDALLVVGCWLIFSLVVIAFTDFKVLSLTAGLGLGLVFLSIALSYFFLFTVLGARTPGMDYMGLAVVRFDGELPSCRDVGLRVFGHCISAGCFGLGFLWAFFDAERLTWHDRISKTLVIEYAPPPDG